MILTLSEHGLFLPQPPGPCHGVLSQSFTSLVRPYMVWPHLIFLQILSAAIHSSTSSTCLALSVAVHTLLLSCSRPCPNLLSRMLWKLAGDHLLL